MDDVGTTSARIRATLRSTFGYTSFRPLQEEIVGAILGGRDVFVLMPTGGGKSLCYQLPALLRGGLTVVVSPLIALMKDQVDALQALGAAATFINSSLDPAEVSRRQAAVARGAVKLLYVAPERLMLPGFLRLLSSVPLAFIAVDEAHCISEWGHDFRPEYRELRRLRALFPATPLGAFTATATRRVQADIKAQLRLQKAASFQGSFNRPNLFYEVRPKADAYGQLAAYLREQGPVSGIVYCGTRAGTERLAARLSADGFSATAYHAGLESDERRRRQEAFIRDDTQIIVATIAFGMGIDKPDVRFVVHYDLPKSLEGYYQESGRAGRDGEPSDCILFYSYGDVAKHRHFVEQKATEEERRVALWQLQQMTEWAQGSTCRRRALLAYFDEPLDGQDGPCCDVCRAPAQEVDYTIPTQMYLSCAKRVGERFGSAYLIDVLRGARNERILRLGHDKLSTHGIGRERPREEWVFLASELLRQGYIRQDAGDFNVVKVTERGHAVLFKGEQVFLAVAVPFQRAGKPSPSDARASAAGGQAATAALHPALFERLRLLRKRLADERGVPPYVVFHDSTLRLMASALPATRAALLRLHGVGERKALDYGEAFLSCIAQYVAETDARGEPDGEPAVRARRGGLSDTVWLTVDLLRAGRSVAEIAAARQLAPGTIEGHVVAAMEAGERIEVERLVSAEKRRAIEAALAEVGMAALRPILERLGEGYSYGEIRIVRAALGWDGT